MFPFSGIKKKTPDKTCFYEVLSVISVNKRRKELFLPKTFFKYLKMKSVKLKLPSTQDYYQMNEEF